MSLKLKILLLGLLPVAVALIIVSAFIRHQADALVERQVAELETRIISEKKRALEENTEVATTALAPFLAKLSNGKATKDNVLRDVEAILESLAFGEDGYFFVYDMSGTSIIHPKQPWRVGHNWLGLRDADGVFLIRELIAAAQNGGGFVSYLWERPATKKMTPKIGYATKVEQFDWMIGTGVYVDEIDAMISALRADSENTVSQIFGITWGVFAVCVLAVGGGVSLFAYRETSFANGKLRELYESLLNVQEEERARVSRDLHDGISQILVSVRYALSLAQKRLNKKHADVGAELDESMERIGEAVNEVRRISADLRPKVLDDLGLAAAVRSLGESFENSTGIRAIVDVVQVGNVLNDEKKSALYRICQEALTNIERHANADEVLIKLWSNKKDVLLSVEDDGAGFEREPRGESAGVGLRNMEERLSHFSGILSLTNKIAPNTGLVVLAEMPLDGFGSKLNLSKWFREG